MTHILPPGGNHRFQHKDAGCPRDEWCDIHREGVAPSTSNGHQNLQDTIFFKRDGMRGIHDLYLTHDTQERTLTLLTNFQRAISAEFIRPGREARLSFSFRSELASSLGELWRLVRRVGFALGRSFAGQIALLQASEVVPIPTTAPIIETAALPRSAVVEEAGKHRATTTLFRRLTTGVRPSDNCKDRGFG